MSEIITMGQYDKWPEPEPTICVECGEDADSYGEFEDGSFICRQCAEGGDE